jgi:hypothetical protein
VSLLLRSPFSCALLLVRRSHLPCALLRPELENMLCTVACFVRFCAMVGLMDASVGGPGTFPASRLHWGTWLGWGCLPPRALSRQSSGSVLRRVPSTWYALWFLRLCFMQEPSTPYDLELMCILLVVVASSCGCAWVCVGVPSVSVCLSVSVFLFASLCIHARLFVHCVYICACSPCVHLCASVCICVHLCASARVRLVYVCVRLCASVCICVCIVCTSVRVRLVYVCVRLCASVCICVHLCASVCICVRSPCLRLCAPVSASASARPVASATRRAPRRAVWAMEQASGCCCRQCCLPWVPQRTQASACVCVCVFGGGGESFPPRHPTGSLAPCVAPIGFIVEGRPCCLTVAALSPSLTLPHFLYCVGGVHRTRQPSSFRVHCQAVHEAVTASQPLVQV